VALAWLTTQPATAEQAVPPRVITLAPHATELLYAAGAGQFLVGTVTSSDYPAAAKDVPRIGDGIVLNQERIIMLQPSLLIGWLRSGVALQVESLADKLGAQTYYARPTRLRDIPAQVRHIGHLLGTEAQAQVAAAAMDERIDALETQYAHRRKVKVFVEVGSTPLYTIGQDPLLNDALAICAAVNVYGDSGVPAPRVSIESLLVADPEVVITAKRLGSDAEKARARWAAAHLPAAIEGSVYGIDPDALFRPGPRFIDAIESVCEAVDKAR